MQDRCSSRPNQPDLRIDQSTCHVTSPFISSRRSIHLPVAFTSIVKQSQPSNSESDIATARWPIISLFRTYSETSHKSPFRQVSLLVRARTRSRFVTGRLRFIFSKKRVANLCCRPRAFHQNSLKRRRTRQTQCGIEANSHGLSFQSCLNQIRCCRPHQADPCPHCTYRIPVTVRRIG